MAMRSMCRHLAQHVGKLPLCSSRPVHASAVQQSSDAGAFAPAACVGLWSIALPAAAEGTAASALHHDVVHSIAAGLRGAGDCVQSLWMAVPKKKAGVCAHYLQQLLTARQFSSLAPASARIVHTSAHSQHCTACSWPRGAETTSNVPSLRSCFSAVQPTPEGHAAAASAAEAHAHGCVLQVRHLSPCTCPQVCNCRSQSKSAALKE